MKRAQQVIDKEGNTLTITDLDAAIAQADLFRNFRHGNRAFAAFDKKQQAYWQHLYETLNNIKSQDN